MNTTRTAVIVFLLSIFLVAPASAKSVAFKSQQSFLFDIRVGALSMGTAKLDIEKTRRKKRRIRVSASINLLGGGAMGISTKSTTWVDRSWKPIRSKWNWRTFGKERRLDAKYGKRRFDGRLFHGPKMHKRMAGKTRGQRQRINDLISIVPWLMSQRIRPGRVYRTRAYTGLQIYRVTGRVGRAETIQLPRGPTRAYPVYITAVRPGKTRRMTLWLDAKTRAPSKAAFDMDFVSQVSLVLKEQRGRSVRHTHSGQVSQDAPSPFMSSIFGLFGTSSAHAGDAVVSH